MKYNYIDLFSGAGGMSLGFDLEGFKNVFSVEYD
ncbi:DNA cytosine methyltransferase, partial [Staphylococcus epidermidis]